MNFKQTLTFYKHIIEKIWKFECFLNVYNNTLLLQKKFEDQTNCIMKTKGPFVKVMLLNEVIKHPLFKPNLIPRFCDSF